MCRARVRRPGFVKTRRLALDGCHRLSHVATGRRLLHIFTWSSVLLACAAAVGPRLIAQEEILLTVDEWLYACDDDEDGKITLTETPALIKVLLEATSMPEASTAKLTPQMILGMADSDGDGAANRTELIDLLQRMKAFDSGTIAREKANTPSGSFSSDAHSYGMSHEQRMRTKMRTKMTKKGTKRRKAESGKRTAKDEV